MEGLRSYILGHKYVGILTSFSLFPCNGDLRGRHERSIDEGEFSNTGFMSVSLAFENCYSESITGVETAPANRALRYCRAPNRVKIRTNTSSL